jgi:aerobic carbon-monoxide dehydrogenase large subunit
MMTHKPLPSTPTFQPLRREDTRLLTGAGSYVADLRLPGMLHLAFVRAGQAGARLRHIGSEAARQFPGVLHVLGATEIGAHQMPPVNEMLPVTPGPVFPLLTHERTDYAGQPLALVIATSAQAALAGAQAVQVDFDEGEAVYVADFADAPAATQVHHQHGSAPADTSLQSVSVRLDSPRVVAMAMEPRATVARWSLDADELTVWTGSQAPTRARADIAGVLGLPLAQVRVISPDVGGAFGAKASVCPEELLVALAARHLKACVRWVASRSDEFTSGLQGRGARLGGTLALDAQGRFASLTADLQFTLGAWMPFSAVIPLRNAARILPGPYRLGHVAIAGRAQLSSLAPVNIYRGAGRPEAALLMETLVDKAARASGIDPVELRRRNLVQADAMPWTTPTGEVFDSGNYRQALDHACLRFDYAGERAVQTERRARGELLGIGVALYVEPCGQGWEAARVTLAEDGHVNVVSGSPAQGQGHLTSFAAIAAQALGCAPDKVTVQSGDTELGLDGIGALASRSIAIGGSAILTACREVLARQRAGEALPITAELRFQSDETWSHGCVIVRLQIDRDTGQPAIERLVWVDDAGRIISPVLARGQLLGGLAQGLGQALMERMVHDAHGQLLSGSLMDYAVPRATDMPPVEIDSLCSPATTNPLGAKGVGEAGCIGLPAALMNAARDALSVFGERELQLPLRAESLWQAMH